MKGRRPVSVVTGPIVALTGTLTAFVVAGSGCADEPRGSARAGARAPSVTGTAPAAAGGLPSVIMLEPQPSRPVPPPTEPAVMDQRGYAFIPKLLLARAGQPVEFRNSEDVTHNVHVVDAATDSTVFSAATVRGEPFRHTFDRTGGYAVSCDIHPGMTAFVLVISTLYAVTAEADGAFALSDVPPGSYRVSVWNADAARRSERAVDITDVPTHLTLTP